MTQGLHGKESADEQNTRHKESDRGYYISGSLLLVLVNIDVSVHKAWSTVLRKRVHIACSLHIYLSTPWRMVTQIPLTAFCPHGDHYFRRRPSKLTWDYGLAEIVPQKFYQLGVPAEQWERHRVAVGRHRSADSILMCARDMHHIDFAIAPQSISESPTFW